MLGLKRGIVKLIPYQSQWKVEFEKEKNYLLTIFNIEIDIEHVGSTAIEGLLAKPIIDILIGFTPDINAESIYQTLRDHNYEDRGDDGVRGENLFVKGSENNRTHHLHIIEKDSTAWYNYIAFRDYLSKHSDVRKEYNLLKQKLAKKYPHNREAYTNGKSEFIIKLLKKVQ